MKRDAALVLALYIERILPDANDAQLDRMQH